MVGDMIFLHEALSFQYISTPGEAARRHYVVDSARGAQRSTSGNHAHMSFMHDTLSNPSPANTYTINTNTPGKGEAGAGGEREGKNSP
jgi:hypothetical protein